VTDQADRAQTFAQKALARAAGLAHVDVGQVVDVRPDAVLSHDNTAAIVQIFRRMKRERVVEPDRLIVVLDHAAPAPTTQHARNHAEARAFVAEQGIRRFYEVGRGVCHQVIAEEALVLPGQMILGADSHTTHHGWMGAFGAGVGRSEVAAIWATGELWLRVPESIRIVVDGDFPPGVTAKDLCLRIIGDLGADGGLYASVEFAGSAIAGLPPAERMVIPNMMAEFGAKNAYLPPDEAVIRWVAERRARRQRREDPQAMDLDALADEWVTRIAESALYPDPNAPYTAEYHFDAGALEPMIACPHTVDNVVPLSEVVGTRVHQAFIGTCTNGRLEDLAAAAEVLRGKRVAAGTRLVVIPASSEVLSEALRLGYIQTFVEAGALVGPPGCGPCMGNHLGILAPGEVCISTANRNFRGRMGTRDSEIYLANPAVVAAAAVAGRIVPVDVTHG
jgi:3-isopropylmalate/(R)-2-methylmalate dehydratase large subunit